jgi:hypothetical protein
MVDFSTNLILGIPIAFLDFAFELVTSAVDSSKVVIGELAPLLFDLARELFPTSFNPIPIHCNLLVLFSIVAQIVLNVWPRRSSSSG